MFEPDLGSSELRLSDADRLHALNVLGEHFSVGRLDNSEFTELSGRAAEARTLAALDPLFAGLPGGVPLVARGDVIQHRGDTSGMDGADSLAPDAVPLGASSDVERRHTAERELDSLRQRGKLVSQIDTVVVGATLVVFLVLMFVVQWQWAWIVWPSLALTLGIPRLMLRFGDDDEELYEELKKSDAKAKKERIRLASRRIRELGERRGGGAEGGSV